MELSTIHSFSFDCAYLTDGDGSIQIGDGIVFLRQILTLDVVLTDVVQAFLKGSKYSQDIREGRMIMVDQVNLDVH